MTRRGGRTTSERLTRKIQLGCVRSLLTDISRLRCALMVFPLLQLDCVRSEDGRLRVTATVTTTKLRWRRYVVSTITVNIRLEY